MVRFPLARPPLSHEELFVQRYDTLLRQAQRLAATTAEAEDLVQDAFIRFSMTRPDLERLDNLDGYLFTVLRNLHLSRVRRAARNELTSLSILEFDSAESGLRAYGVRDGLEVREALRAACVYGCARRASSKAGSLFLLRFFHGAVPTEIARIAGVHVRVVDRWLTLARREAEVFRDTPERLAFLNGEAVVVDWRQHAADGGAAGVLGDCRAHIFSLRHPRCWSDRELDSFYSAAGGALAAETLAEIVTCPSCLERVCGRLGIHRLDDRFPSDTLGRHRRRGGAMGADRKQEILRQAIDRLSDLREHRPRELRLAINGFVMTSQAVTSGVTELTLTVSLNEPVTLAEVFSERGVCVAALDIEPAPLGPARQQSTTALSEGRSVEMTVTFAGPWPTLHAVYRDPELHAASAGVLASEIGPVEIGPIETGPSEIGGVESERIAAPRRAPVAALLVRLAGACRPRWTAGPGRRVFACAMALLVVAALLFGSPESVVAAMRRFGQAAIDAVTRVLDRRQHDPAPSSRIVLPSRALDANVSPVTTPVPPSTRAHGLLTTPSAVPSASELAGIELQALGRLAQVDAYLGQEVSLSRSTTGITISAVVKDARRREALMDSVSPLLAHRPLRMRVSTMEGAITRMSGSTATVPTEVRSVELPQARDGLPPELRAYVATLLPADASSTDRSAAIDREARRFASRIVDGSQRASRHAWALKHLADRFLLDEMPLDSDGEASLRSLLRTHARAFQHQIAMLKRDLQPVFFPRGALDDVAVPPDEAAATHAWPGLRTTIARLLALDGRRVQALSATFSLSVGREAGAVLEPELWTDLDGSERLALEILTPVIR